MKARDIADEDDKGWPSKKGVSVYARLMGWVQRGEKMMRELVNKPAPPPIIEGIQPPVIQHSTGTATHRSLPPGLPVLTPQDRAKFLRIFQVSGPENGLLTGQKAWDLFMKSKLPVEKLDQIWELADTQERGALDETDFIIAMYLIKASMSGQLSSIPTSLPPRLYKQACNAGDSFATNITEPFSMSPTSSQQQYSLSRALPAQHTSQSKASVLPLRPTAHGIEEGSNSFVIDQQAWDMTPEEQARTNRFFNTLDSKKLGYIEGEVAANFMLQSNLSKEVLAQVWDLADTNKDGRLTRDGFAIAMHLIHDKLAGKEIPKSLPQSFITPFMQSNHTSSSSTPASRLQESPRPVQDIFRSTSFEESFEKLAAPLSTLQGQSDAITEFQLNSTNRSSHVVETHHELLEQKLVAQLSALQTQLSSINDTCGIGTNSSRTLRDKMDALIAGIQHIKEELASTDGGLNVASVQKAEVGVEDRFLPDDGLQCPGHTTSDLEILALHAEVADSEFQNPMLKIEKKYPESDMEQITDEHGEERREIRSDGIESRSALANAVAGPSRITAHQPRQGPEILFDTEGNYRDPVYRASSQDPTDRLLKQYYNDSALAEQMQYAESATEMQWYSDEKALDLLCTQFEELAKYSQHPFECGICMEEQSESYIAAPNPCGHEFCRACIRNYILTKLEERRFPILCPLCMTEGRNDNPTAITSAFVQQIGITEQQYEMWVELEMTVFSVLLRCSQCKQSAFVDKQDLEDVEELICPFPACSHVWCKRCQQTINPSGPEHSCDGLSELEYLMKQNGWKYCPSCRTPIEKKSGCNHMVCISPGCNTHFCYLCGGTAYQQGEAHLCRSTR